MFGFPNAGNTCYFNAALQVMLHCPQLTNYFLGNLHVGDVNRRRKKNGVAFIDAYKRLVDAYWSSTTAPGTAVEEVRAAFSKACAPGFENGLQHDAHEALMAMLKTVHEGLSKTAPIAGSKVVLTSDRLAAWRRRAKDDGYSILTEIFQTQTEIAVEEVDGAYRNVTYDHAFDMSIGCIRRLSTSEIIFPYKKDDGTETTICRRQTITHLPLVLVVRVPEKETSYPMAWTTEAFGTYSLFGIVLHRGDVQSGGHYSALVRGRDGAWHLFDDEGHTVLQTDDFARKNHHAYVLLYKKNLTPSAAAASSPGP